MASTAVFYLVRPGHLGPWLPRKDQLSASRAEAVGVVGALVDPELRRPLGELGMVRDVRSRLTGLEVVLALPEGYPDPAALAGQVRQALESSGLGRAKVRTEAMSAEERARLRQALQPTSDPRPPRPAGPGEGRPNQFSYPASSTRVVGISSGKGGVGKSSVTVNLAISLARMGREVAVLDADVYGFSIPGMLGIDRKPMVVEDLLVPPVAHGVRCVSMGFFVEEQTPVIWRGPMLHKALEQFLVDVAWGPLDFLLVDMPPGTGDVALSMSQYLPKSEVLVVTTPQLAAQRVAQRSAYAARKLRLPLRGVIENMSWFTGDDGKRYELFGSGGGQALAEELGVPLLGQVPLVPELRQGGDRGVPVTVSDPEGEASMAFEAIARALDAMPPARVYRKELTVR